MFKKKEKEVSLDKYSVGLLENFRELQFSDIIGIGNILGVPEEDDFDDYITAIVATFMEMPKSKRKAILKLTKEVIKDNKKMMADPNFCKVPPEELAKQVVEATKNYHEKKVEDSSFLSMVKKKYPPGV